MHEQILKDGLVKILKICCRNGFLNLQTTKSTLISIQYGPLGSLFTKNIRREWLSSAIHNSDACMFPIDIIKLKNETKLKQNSIKVSPFFSGLKMGVHVIILYAEYFRQLYLYEITHVFNALKNYFRYLSVCGKGNPFGFAIYGPLIGLDQNDVLLDIPLLRKFEYRNGLCITFFCPTKKSSDWFNYWSRYRYRWWRKFSSIPSKFLMSDVTEIKGGHQQISIMMEFPWGKENLETVTLYGDDFIKNCCQAFGLQHIDIQNVPAVIVCESELNLAAFAYLSNSFAQKWRDREIRKLFQLHTKLAPYKVCISVNSDCPNDRKRLKDIAIHLEKELKKCRVPVFPCYDSGKDCAQDFNRFDEMAVPYTIVLNNKALNSGIVGLRNRDTTLEEQVHITELTVNLLKYLQMKSFDAEES